MKDFVKLFWNGDQNRPRTLWRLCGQLLIFGALLIIPETIASMVAFGMLVASGDVTQNQLSDPGLVQSAIMDHPLVIMTLYAGLIPAAVLSVWLSGRFLDRRPFVDFGFHINREWWIDLCFGMGLGALLMALIFGVEWVAGWVIVVDIFATRSPDLPFLLALFFPFLTYLGVAFYEELFSRGYHLKNMAEGLNFEIWGPRGSILLAAVLSSLIFGVLHALNPHASIFSILNISAAGMFLASGYVLTGELAIPMGLHFTWNFFQGNVFGFPVSGASLRSAAILEIEQGGPQHWTGGAFGPEAGLLGLGAMLLGMAMTLWWVKWRRGTLDVHLPLAQPPGQTRTGEDEPVHG